MLYVPLYVFLLWVSRSFSPSCSRRYKAVMSPLSERSSKSSAKATLVCLWSAGAVLAAPSVFFFEFTHVFDDLNGGTKPFCAVTSSLVGGGASDSFEAANSSYINASALAEDQADKRERDQEMDLLQKMTTFQAYNCLLALFQVGTFLEKPNLQFMLASLGAL